MSKGWDSISNGPGPRVNPKSKAKSRIKSLKSNAKLRAKGVIIESKLDKGRGPVATLVVQSGTLYVGEPFIVGCHFGKVRALIGDSGRKIKKAAPSTHVEIVGLPDVPQPGDHFMVVQDERKARQLSNLRLQQQREVQLAKSTRITIDDLHQQIIEGQDLQRIGKGTSDAKEITFSFYAKANAAATYTVELFDANNSVTMISEPLVGFISALRHDTTMIPNFPLSQIISHPDP